MLSEAWKNQDAAIQDKIATASLVAMSGNDRLSIANDVAFLMNTRAQTMMRKKPEDLAKDLTKLFARLKPASQALVLTSHYHPTGERALLFNQLIGCDIETHPKVGVSLEFTMDTLAPYETRFGCIELTLALAFVAEFGRSDCVTCAEQLARSRLRPAPQKRLPRTADLMQEITVAMEPAVIDPPPPTADHVELDEWDAAVGMDAIAPSDDANTTAEDEAPATKFADDWSLPETRDDEIDRVIMRAIVAHANKEDGALNETDLRGLVKRIVRLNSARFRSYFYLGFTDALLGAPQAGEGKGINKPRRAWYLAGYCLGLRRMTSEAEFLEHIAALTALDTEALFDSAARGAAQKLLKEVVTAAIRGERLHILSDWIHRCGPYDEQALLSASRLALSEPEETPERNLNLLSVCLGCFDERRAIDEVKIRHDIEYQLILSIVGLLREQHGTKRYTQELRLLRAEQWSGHEAAELRVALVLHDAECPTLKMLMPTEEPSLARLVKQLHAHSTPRSSDPLSFICDLLQTLASGKSARTMSEAELCDLLDEVQDFQRAMRRRLNPRYATYFKTEFDEVLSILSALVVVVRGIEARFELSAKTVLTWMTAGGRLPQSWLRSIFDNMTMLDSPLIPAFFTECVRQHGAEIIDLESMERAATSAEVRDSLLKLLHDDRVKMTTERRWHVAMRLGRAAATGAVDPETSLACIEELERIVDREPSAFGERFIKAIDSDCWWPVVREDVRQGATIRVARKIGRYDLVARHLIAQLQQALAKPNAFLAHDLVDLIDSCGLATHVSPECRSHVEALISMKEPRPSSAEAAKPVRILFVGGNEMQAAWEGENREWLRVNAPGVHVEFIHSGWGSNWTKYVEEVDRKLPLHSALVLMQFVRTILGEKVRKLASVHNKPWIACTGHGSVSIRRTIVEAARVARTRG